ncbi:hypothetical protein [Spirosoma areae]
MKNQSVSSTLLLVIGLTMALQNCKKAVDTPAPAVTTPPGSTTTPGSSTTAVTTPAFSTATTGNTVSTTAAVTSLSARVFSTLAGHGGATITQHGHVYSNTDPQPAVRLAASPKTELGPVPATTTFPYSYSSSLSGLESNTTYTVRPYATTDKGTTTYGATFQVRTAAVTVPNSTTDCFIATFAEDLNQEGGASKYRATYTYQNNRLLSRIATTSTFTPATSNTAVKATSSESETVYAYDANEFVTTAQNTTKQFTQGTLTSTATVNTQYTYDKGLVIRADQVRDGVTTRTTYEYDNAGRLTKSTTSGPTANWNTLYTNGVPTLFTNISSPSTTTYTREGYIDTQTTGDFMTTNQYNAQGQLIRSNTYQKTVLSAYYVVAYSSQKSRDYTVPAFKGHPVLPPTQGIRDYPRTMVKGYALVNGVITQTSEVAYTAQANARGYVEKYGITNRSVPSNAITSTVAQSIAYINCP